MEVQRPSFFDSNEDAQNYSKRKLINYGPTALSMILKFYQEAHPEWNPETTKLPLIVDLACGDGRLTQHFSKYCEKLIALDAAPGMINLAKANNEQPHVEFNVSPAETFSQHCPPHSADLIVAGMAAHYFANDMFYAEVKKCLKPGGVLALVSFWYPGFRGLGQEYESVIEECFMKNAKSELIQKNFYQLKASYRNLYFPLENAVRREVFQTQPLTIDDVSRLGMPYLVANLDNNMSKIRNSLPPRDNYDLIVNVFCLFWQAPL